MNNDHPCSHKLQIKKNQQVFPFVFANSVVAVANESDPKYTDRSN